LASEHRFTNILRDSRYAIDAQLGDVDLSTWIAALGFPQVPLTGRVDAAASMNGRFPRLNLKGTADLKDGTVWRLPIDQANVAFSSSDNRIVLDNATLSAPGLAAHASGSFGLSMDDPLALSLYASSDDLPKLVAQLWRIQLPVSGEFESTLDVKGSLARPTFEATFDATGAKLYGLDVPLAYGSMQLRGRDLLLRDAGIELRKGTVAIEGSLPIVLQPFGIGPQKAPMSFDLTFNQVDPSAFDAIAGNNSKFGGTIDGELGISGTVETPRVSGKFSIANGSYVSDLDLTPITGLVASLTFDRTTATVNTLKAHFGSGTVTGSGYVTFPNGFESAAAGGAGGAAFSVKGVARGAQLNLPQYGTGTLDANLTLARTPGQTAKFSGDATLSNATIPFGAFIAATQNTNAVPPGFLPALDFDVTMMAGKNVRVRGSGYGAGLDIGAAGAVHLVGSLADPSLDGSFRATGGTLTYFDRAFRVQHAVVTFDPSAGIIPTLHATGTTRVTNPDPNTAVNPYGSADITVAVNGPINALKIDFSSDPPGYSQEQILAMIAPFGGLINGLSYAPGLNEPTLNPNGGGNNNNFSPVPGAQPVGGQAGTLSAGQEAFNVLNAQFSAGLLSPLEGALSQGLGLQNVNLTLDYYGNVGISASRFLGKTVNFLYATTFGIPQRTSFGLQLLGQRATSAQLSFYFQNGPVQLFQAPVANESSGNRLSVGLPLQGQNGFAFTLQRLFW
jgi:autotransporter translocation and assembly factor TamB